MLLSWSTRHTALRVTQASTVATEVQPMRVCFRHPAPDGTHRAPLLPHPLRGVMAPESARHGAFTFCQHMRRMLTTTWLGCSCLDRRVACAGGDTRLDASLPACHTATEREERRCHDAPARQPRWTRDPTRNADCPRRAHPQ